MARQKGRQPGPQSHAEGEHGNKTHRRFIEQLQGSAPKVGAIDTTDEDRAVEAKGRPVEGHHRLAEGRQQHDEAEKNSEKVEAIRRARLDSDSAVDAEIPRAGDGR